MERSGIRSEERTGLIIALVLHLAVIAALAIQALMPAPEIPVTERMTVNLAEDVGLEATAPDPVPESRAAEAPQLSDTPAPVAPPVPDVVEPARPVEVDRPVTRPSPAPTRAAATRRETARQPARVTRNTPRETPREARREAAPPKKTERSGGSRIGDNFLAGSGSSTTTSETRTPASQIGASAKASIVSAIARQVRPHWQGKAPSGADAELLVTVLAFDLNPDGSLKGRPRVVSQSGVNAANEAQKDRHAEVAVRAVQLAAPFDLPDEYYEAWKSVRGARFDRNLSR
ncbi:MAG: energy transducer TonB [Citromicrobium sp.]|nr:MAG: energy transducer TonB [Citromicrobium sp.]